MLHKKSYLTLLIGCFVMLTLIIGCQEEETIVTVPPGTSVTIALQTPLSTATADNGQQFTAITENPVYVGNEMVIPANSAVKGSLSNVIEPGSVDGEAMMTLNFNNVVIDGEDYAFEAAPITLVGDADTNSDIERVAAGTVAGAIIGGIVKGGDGAAIGALIGAGAGGTWAVVTKGEQIVLEPGQKFRIETTASSKIPVENRS